MTAHKDSQLPDDFQTERVFTIGAGHFVHDTFTAFLAAILPLLRTRFDLAYAVAGSLAIFVRLPTLFNPLIGYIADRTSVRYFIIFAPAVSATLMSLLGVAPGFWTLVVLLVLTGFSSSAFHVPAGGMIGAVAGSKAGRGMSIYMASGELGRTLGPILIAGGIALYGIEGAWRLAFLGWFASAILFWRLYGVEAQPRAAGSRTINEMWPNVRHVFGVIALLLVSRNMMAAGLTTFLTTYMSDAVGWSFARAAISFSILEGASVIGALSSGTMSDRFGRKRVLLFLFITAPLLLIAFIYSPAWMTIPLLIGLGLTAIPHTPVYLAIVQDHFPDNRSLGNGIFMAMSFLLRSIALFVLGLLSDQLGLENAYLIAALAAFLAIPALYFLPDGPKAAVKA